MTEVVARAPKLILKYQGAVLKECLISKDELTIGRKPDNDLVLDDPAVSGHHARIVKIQAVYVVEDRQSTNGLLVNGHKVDRKQLRDADVVTIGKHRLVFLEEGISTAPIPAPASEVSDKTVVIRSGEFGATASARSKVGMLRVLDGKTERTEYRLTKQLSVVGSQSDATVRLTGFFAPKTAAIIGRRGQSYSVTVPERGKAIHVNDLAVEDEAELKDGDLIVVAGVTMHFSLRDMP